MKPHPTNLSEIAWSSWLAPLLGCWAESKNPNLIEVGIGHFSTPALHALVLPGEGTLFSLEESSEWLGGFKTTYEVPGKHMFIEGPYDASIGAVKAIAERDSFRFAVGFIDESPGGLRRLKSFLALQDCCDFLVVHDYWRENEEAIRPYLKGMEWKVCNTYHPPTLVASKTRKIPSSLV